VKSADVVIVTPASAVGKTGNWQTAHRWAGFLAARYRVRVTERWQRGNEALMIALHARRSAPSMAAWRSRFPERPLALVLTGTDLYRDIDADPSAQRSLHLADRLVVLNDLGARRLPAGLRDRVTVCLQSASPRRPRPRTARRLRALMVGHLREEKAPRTFFDAVRRLVHRPDIVFDHVGGSLDEALAAEARALAAGYPAYRWIGALPHGATRARIAAAHLLVHPSLLEGGAHVVIEAVVSGTPVLASRIDGNVGLLGAGYSGYFETGDGNELAALLVQARDDARFLAALREQTGALASRFAPERERETVLALARQLLAGA
jgi:putative glycosyltransferase (TIGR04348 family)